MYVYHHLGDKNITEMHEGNDKKTHINFSTLAQCYANVVSRLPMPTNNANADNNLYFQN